MAERLKQKRAGLKGRVARVVGLVVLVVAAFVLYLQKRTAPRFLRNVDSGMLHAFGGYPHDHPVPFTGGRTWVAAGAATNGTQLLLNFESGRVEGEFEGKVMLLDGKNGRAVCITHPGPASGLERKLRGIIEELTGRSARKRKEPVYWLVDLKTGTSKRLGKVHGGWPPMFPSPDFSRAFLPGFAAFKKYTLGVFDLIKGDVETREPPGWATGWWDESTVLCKSLDGTLWLYDVTTTETAVLLHRSEIAAWIEKHGLTVNLTAVNPVPVWNGAGYNYYVEDAASRASRTNGLLARLTKAGKLQLIKKDFDYGWSGDLHPAEPLYVFTERPEGEGGNALYLRNYETDEERIIAPADDGIALYPRFYSNNVVFVRDGALWKVGIDGSNAAQLFARPE